MDIVQNCKNNIVSLSDTMNMFVFYANANMLDFMGVLSNHVLYFPNIQNTGRFTMALTHQCLFSYTGYLAPVRLCSDTLHIEHRT